jgi:hypothetical protein
MHAAQLHAARHCAVNQRSVQENSTSNSPAVLININRSGNFIFDLRSITTRDTR